MPAPLDPSLSRPLCRNRRRTLCAQRAEADIAPFVTERRGLYPGRAALVLRPGSVDEVSRILKLATETRTPVVPQGGNTGLVGGQMPDRSGREIVLSLSRLDRIREIDPLSNTVTAEAGVILENLHEAADAAGPAVPAVARLAGLLPDRRQSLVQCRRHRRARLWQCARALPRRRGGAADRRDASTICAS